MEIVVLIFFGLIAWGCYKAFGPDAKPDLLTSTNTKTPLSEEAQKGKDMFNGFLILAGAVIVVGLCLRMCNRADDNQTSNNDTSNQTNATDNGNKSLTYNKNILENYPFLISFSPARKSGNISFIEGRSQTGRLSATINYDPSDNQIRDIQFELSGLPLNPTNSDIQILLDYTEKYDRNFAGYFERNRQGIFVNENDFIDDARFANKVSGFAISVGGDVAYNNMAIKEHPEQRNEILDLGSFLSVNIVNLNKPSDMVDLINSGKTIDR